jgi:hypothetical protein
MPYSILGTKRLRRRVDSAVQPNKRVPGVIFQLFLSMCWARPVASARLAGWGRHVRMDESTVPASRTSDRDAEGRRCWQGYPARRPRLARPRACQSSIQTNPWPSVMLGATFVNKLDLNSSTSAPKIQQALPSVGNSPANGVEISTGPILSEHLTS